MSQYVGLDVSQDETHVCVVDRDGNKIWEGSCDSTPEGIGAAVKEHAPDALKIGLESGHLSTWHWHGLTEVIPARQKRKHTIAYDYTQHQLNIILLENCIHNNNLVE